MTDHGRPRVGVVGVGSLGFHHARILAALAADGEVEMAGIHDRRPERVEEIAGKLDVPARGSLEELLDRADAIVIAVPTRDHESVAVRALERGIHVLVEKPMAPDLAAADRILEAAEASGAVVQIGHVERFNPAVLAAEEHLDRPLFVESHRMAPFTPRSTDVAVVLDLMIHDVDLVQSLMGTPIREIAASGVPVLTPSVDIANARLTFQNGAVANLTASRISAERMRKIRIFQPSGYLSLDLATGRGEFLRLRAELPALAGALAGGTPAGLAGLAADGSEIGGLEDIVEHIPLVGDGTEPLRKELENFANAVRGEAPPAVSGRDGRAALAITLSIEDRIENHVVDSRPA
ncbi:MAG: Gfo/Idh/MocA family oxidoreductase [Gemmatimonadota bacterium]